MKLRNFALAGAALLCVATSASASSRGQDTGSWYVGVGAGLAMPTDVEGYGFDKTWRAVGAAGYAFQNHLRVELEVGYTDPSLSGLDWHVRQLTSIINVFCDIPLNNRVSATVGAGAGWAYVTTNLWDHNNDADGFAWQAVAGLTYKLTGKIDLQLDYRYTSLQSISSFELPSHNLMLSTRLHI